MRMRLTQALGTSPFGLDQTLLTTFLVGGVTKPLSDGASVVLRNLWTDEEGTLCNFPRMSSKV